MCGEVAQEWGFVGQVHAGDLLAVLPDFQDDLDNVVDVALGVDAAGDRQADQVHLCGRGEHECPDFYRTDSTFQIQFCRESYAGKLVRGNVREKGARVEIDGVAARRLDDGNSVACDVIAEVGGGGYAVAQVVLFEGFLHADGDGFEIASGEAAVGGISLGENEQVFFLLG